MLSVLSGYSQSLKFIDHSDMDVTGDTLTVNGLPTDFEIVQEIDVTNCGSATLSVKVKKRIHYNVTGATNTFCWVLCYSTTTIVSSQAKSMAPGDTTDGANGFSGHFYPNGYTGEALISYTAFDNANSLDSAIVYVKFISGTSGINDYEGISLNTPYPNPADNSMSFDIDLISGETGSLTIHSVVGKEIFNASIPANQKKINLNTSGMNNGVYIYSIKDGKKSVKTGRFVISH